MSESRGIVAQEPIVFTRDGEVFANSLDVAERFGKEHRNVLARIDAIVRETDELGDPLRYKPISYNDTYGRSQRAYDMDREAFSILVMGFSGEKAMRWKILYTRAFKMMEEELLAQAEAKQRKANPAAIDVRDPAQLAAIALQLIGVNKELEQRAAIAEEKVEEMKPQVTALERIAISDGSLCITDAAKTLQMQPKNLFAFLRSHKWIYRRTGSSCDVAYQDKLANGLLEHKTTTITRSDGSEKTVTQVRVTPKGLARLGREFPPLLQLVA